MEAAFERLIAPGAAALARGVSQRVADALDDGDEQKALDALREFSTKKLIKDAKGRARVLAASSLVLGAVNAGADPATTAFEEDGLPPEMESCLTVFFAIVGPVLEEYVIAAGERVINDILYEEKEANAVRKAADPDYVLRLNAAVNGGSQMMASIGANLTTSRLVTYGFLYEATKQKVETYQLDAILDKRTSDICRALDKRQFRVEGAIEYVRQVLQVTDPEALKAVAPWLKGDKATVEDLKASTSNQLQEKYGVMVPPFHPRCRTVLSLVNSKVVVNDGAPPTPLTAPETVQPDGMSIGPDGKRRWKENDEALRHLIGSHNNYVDPDESNALREYISDDEIGNYQDINRYLRTGKNSLYGDDLKPYVDEIRYMMDPSDTELRVYRGFSGNMVTQPGDVLEWKGFTSTSASMDWASKPSNGDVMFDIRVTPGTKGIATNLLEREFLLDHQTRFRVVSVETDVTIEVTNSKGSTETQTFKRYITLETVP